ncbi:hypothetical protein [Leptolyngbya sp. NIES-2104]|uniref:hypothetical protein n=1 Tax=Leptolyngbya sp. NIES-2104 TaxID=1552121 RepID=UPI0006EC979B|nr:hypothetical protein [Leptolyngbya sp. NIES-2104]GAP96694.1 hypothetical protein NIES2104_32370 [Leptolyngbya sp. NIES-2104]
MPHDFYFGQSREMSALHWLMENRPLLPSPHEDTVELLVKAACRQCLIEASWKDAAAVELCRELIDRTHPPTSAQKLLERCQAGELEAFEQALLRLQQQVMVEIMRPPDAE